MLAILQTIYFLLIHLIFNKMIKNIKKGAVVFGITVCTLFGCKKTGENGGNYDRGMSAATIPVNQRECVDIPVDANGIITISTLTNDKNWKLNGVSYVDSLQTLTIQPGTRVITGATKTYNDPLYGPQTLAGVLVVAKGGRLVADGTADPIVFTTPQIAGCTSGGCSTAGKGPSIVMLGRSTTNRTTPPRIEGIPKPSGKDITYGGNLPGDDSGILKYVRIEFPGFLLRPDNEINGLTLGGVGSGTVLSHIQVSYSADDAFEFFGGTVNADHLVAIGTDDDDYDFDFGYTGTIDYAIGLKNPNSTHSKNSSNPALSDSNGLESDNDGTGTGATPKTNPTLRHFTLLGYATNSNLTDLLNGNRWRRESSLNVQSSIIAGFPTGVRFESAGTIAAAASFTGNIVHAYTTVFAGATPAGNATSTLTPANNYLLLGSGGDPFLTCANSGSYNPANLVPDLGSPADGTSSTFKGAFDPNAATLWTANWTNFNPGFCCN
jgi:hypothetical protein